MVPPIRIPIHERVELPESWIPADSRVEIDAKITAGRWFPSCCLAEHWRVDDTPTQATSRRDTE